MRTLTKPTKFIKQLPWEAIIWTIGLIFLALYNPSDASHITICPLALTGIEWCPGCGLGRSVSFLFKGEISQSIIAHPLGIFAIIVLSFRIINLTKKYLRSYGKSY